MMSGLLWCCNVVLCEHSDSGSTARSEMSISNSILTDDQEEEAEANAAAIKKAASRKPSLQRPGVQTRDSESKKHKIVRHSKPGTVARPPAFRPVHPPAAKPRREQTSSKSELENRNSA
ncbi:unnamed protein product [Soboliphyme baturini]|uniref:Shugoshin_C domain-containing protein n=1 Tax=Soboliphyme baturini TaxID=241478 RepID=A0A183IQT1_9BILA|nr:unnamed protein product [Soboliphyme baturini]